MADNKTSIVHCKRCGFHTRHEWQRWESRDWLFFLTGRRLKTVEGLVCTKCGRRRAVRTV
jgi:DNA-directed RNA polymerase subunit RPC12/RpoP